MHTYAIFSALYAPHVGGVETYTAQLARELAQRGNRAIVVTSQLSAQAPERTVQPDDVEVWRLPARALMGGRLPIPRRTARHHALLDELASCDVDRVVVNTRFYGHSLDGARFAARTGTPALGIEHGSAHLCLANPLANAAVHAYEHMATARIKRYNLPFYGVSSAAVAWLSHFGIAGAGVIPNALDAKRYLLGASARDFRAELDVAPDALLVALVGRLVPEKGVGALCEAARELADGNMVFAVAGDGPLEPQVRAAGAHVHALGRLAPADVVALLGAADVLALPSRSEGFATTLLEAVAARALPATTRVGGVAELGIGEVGGMILPDGSAESLARALRRAASLTPNERAAQTDALFERACARSSWSATADALEAAFDRLTA